MDLYKPRAAGAVRRPTDDNQKSGSLVNQPRYARFGGLKNAGATGGKDGMKVDKPADGKKVI